MRDAVALIGRANGSVLEVEVEVDIGEFPWGGGPEIGSLCSGAGAFGDAFTPRRELHFLTLIAAARQASGGSSCCEARAGRWRRSAEALWMRDP